MDRTNVNTLDRVWDYADTSWSGIDLTGFGVEATDGSIGSIDESSNEAGDSYLVIDTGPWIFGKKVLLPAGVIASVDTEERKVFVTLTKDQIKNGPEFDEQHYREADYRTHLGTYYGGGTVDRPAGPDYGAGRTDDHPLS
ncbi:MAG TPA: PRC-barrel domain containing protein [Candidatus Limnocylindria bacterium]|nr:PRC-barrel domain containing protein [Candidatus Limnocylindria bacterium]